jgi:segregation and condensation protein B
MEDLKHIVESLLFVSEDPLTVERIKGAVDFADAAEVRKALEALAQEYEARGGGFELKQVAGGYQIRTRPEYKEYIKRFLRSAPPRLSRAALETLSIVAYYKPITRTDIERIRGVDCGGVLRMLLERNLIRVLGRKEVPGRPIIYETTKRFLQVFDLKDIHDLPTLQEIEALGKAEPVGASAPAAAAGAATGPETQAAETDPPQGSPAQPSGPPDDEIEADQEAERIS